MGVQSSHVLVLQPTNSKVKLNADKSESTFLFQYLCLCFLLQAARNLSQVT